MINIPVEPKITEYLHQKAARAAIPLSGTFELTPVCNMNCKMCYVRMSKSQQESIHRLYSGEEWLSLAKEAKDRGMLYLLLTGGEPFLRDDLKDILAGLCQLGLVVSMNSNGTLIDEKVMEWLVKTPPVRINITLYGSSNETYARLCNNPKGFDQVKHAIRLLKEAGIVVKLNCSLTPDNADDLEGIMEFARSEGLVVQATSYMFPPLRKDKSLIGKNNRFSAKDAAYYSAKIERLLNGDERFLERMKNTELLTLNTDNEDCGDIEGEGIRCRAGKCSFWITWDGRMLPCGMLPDQGVNVFEKGFDQSWQEIHRFALDIRLPAKCKSCSLKDQCKACAAMVMTESGNFHDIPQYRCDMAHEYISACKIVEKEILGSQNEE